LHDPRSPSPEEGGYRIALDVQPIDMNRIKLHSPSPGFPFGSGMCFASYQLVAARFSP
jgi:hypothetical protein